MRLIRSLRYHLAHGGILSVLRKGLSRLRGLAFREEEWLLLEAEMTDIPLQPLPPHLRAEEVDVPDLIRLGYFKALHYPEDLEARVRVGDLAVGFFVEGALGHVAWMSRGRLPLDVGLPDYPAPGAVGIYDMFTLPEFRRRGLQTFAITDFARRGRTEGFQRAVATVHEGNEPSLAAFHRCGFRIAGRIRYRRVLWRGKLRSFESLADQRL